MATPKDGLIARWLGASRHVQLLRVAWLFALWYAEWYIFVRSAVCRWPYEGAEASTGPVSSLQVLLLSDAQILDGKSYPNLPRPLSFIAQAVSDQYMRKAWSALVLRPRRALARSGRDTSEGAPDAVIWLGDLTDGGRTELTDEQYDKLHDRFDTLFSSPSPLPSSASFAVKRDLSAKAATTLSSKPAHLPIYYLSGNHDVGLPLAPGQNVGPYSFPAARPRFRDRYGTPVLLGPTNGGKPSLDIAWLAAGSRFTAPPWYSNDTSAPNIHPQPVRKSANARVLVSADPAHKASHELVLIDAQDLVGMQRVGGQWASPPPAQPGVFGGALRKTAQARFAETYAFVEALKATRDTSPPRILLTHVPLWRPDALEGGCDIASRFARHGVRREASRALRQGTDRDSTFQNLVAREVSDWVLDSVGPSVVFSGDDHDHCEYAHPHTSSASRPNQLVSDVPPNTVPELTLKSFSMSMGVRRPGYTRLSLSLSSSSKTSTGAGNLITAPQARAQSISYTTCLLPNQLGIWLGIYLPLLVGTVLLLVLRARRAQTSRIRRLRPRHEAYALVETRGEPDADLDSYEHRPYPNRNRDAVNKEHEHEHERDVERNEDRSRSSHGPGRGPRCSAASLCAPFGYVRSICGVVSAILRTSAAEDDQDEERSPLAVFGLELGLVAGPALAAWIVFNLWWW